ncbi:MAG: peroxidase family protein [Saprospiraceae bacterium]
MFHQNTAPDFISASNYPRPGKFGRMFPYLDAWSTDELDPEQYLNIIGDKEDFLYTPIKDPPEGVSIPAGYTYLGQFLTHDLSFDPTSIAERMDDLDFLWNYRSPGLDLDSMYGGGPKISPYLYDDEGAFLLETKNSNFGDVVKVYDVPRLNNKPIIADPRNDENVMVSQLHVAFMKLHNKMLEIAAPHFHGFDRFLEARRMTIWHYQYVILHDYLPKILGEKMREKIIRESRLTRFGGCDEPFIPVEFSAAIFRFGHSQVRNSYQFNQSVSDTTALFPDKRPDRLFYVDWQFFFGEGVDTKILQKSNLTPEDINRIYDFEKYIAGYAIIPASIISPIFVSSLSELGDKNHPINLVKTTLLRGLKLKLPSGQSIAKSLGFDTLNWVKLNEFFNENKFPKELEIQKFQENTPLFYYILAEAVAENNGETLGSVGGYILCEVLTGLLKTDKNSYLNINPDWVPEDINGNKKTKFEMADLLQLAGVFPGAFPP